MESASSGPALMAVSDLHVSYPVNRELLAGLRPRSAGDWLIVAGDVGEKADDIAWALDLLSSRFAKVIWVPGNHELWTHPTDPVQLRGDERYQYLVTRAREAGAITPEDPYLVWAGPGGPATIAPLFLLYDYTFLPPNVTTREAALALAYDTGIVCTDERFLHPDPYSTRQDWCAVRLELTRQRLAERDPDLPTVLIGHWPLTRDPTQILTYPQFAQWCGTTATADWHREYNAAAVVYGHLHIPRTTWEDGVRFEEVSWGYPREWQRRGEAPRPPRQILPAPPELA